MSAFQFWYQIVSFYSEVKCWRIISLRIFNDKAFSSPQLRSILVNCSTFAFLIKMFRYRGKEKSKFWVLWLYLFKKYKLSRFLCLFGHFTVRIYSDFNLFLYDTPPLVIHNFPLKHDLLREKEEIWPSPMTEAPTPTEKSKKQRDNTKNATKNFDYTTIADRLRTVSWGSDSHPAGVVKPVYGIPTFPLTAKAV